jgi:hypothetical protein
MAESRNALRSDDISESTDEDEELEESLGSKEMTGLLERIRAVPEVCFQLRAVNDAVGSLFAANFGISSIRAGVNAPDVYKKLFIQVSFEHGSLKCVSSNNLITDFS